MQQDTLRENTPHQTISTLSLIKLKVETFSFETLKEEEKNKTYSNINFHLLNNYVSDGYLYFYITTL